MSGELKKKSSRGRRGGRGRRRPQGARSTKSTESTESTESAQSTESSGSTERAGSPEKAASSGRSGRSESARRTRGTKRAKSSKRAGRSSRPRRRRAKPAAVSADEPIILEELEPVEGEPALELLPEIMAEAEPPMPVEVEAELVEPAPRRRKSARRESPRRESGRRESPRRESARRERRPAESESPRRRPRKGPDKVLVMSATSKEQRLAILENGVVAEIFMERDLAPAVVGNIYKGRVTKVLPGMQAAFVDIGLERDAFLYVSDISLGFEDYEGPLNLEMVEGADEIRKSAPRGDRHKPIQDLISQGQELLVQVTKEGIGQKGSRITSYATIAGRFLVLMPQVDHVGVSRKIGDARERSRLRRIVEKKRPKGLGFVVRTVARGATKTEIEGDVAYLSEVWEKARIEAEKNDAPARVHAEPGILWRVLRDHFNQDVTKVVVDSEESRDHAVDFISRYDPEAVSKVELYEGDSPLMDRYGVQAELDKALKSRVWLKSGGYLIINQTEALVAIDVNTGKFVGKRNLEDTVLKTNLEAGTEVVRQLRLRDLGGIIVVDFIDMESRRNRRKLVDAFEKELQTDRARTKVLQVSDFGLVEITRQRTKKSLERLLTRSCPYCSGAGKIKSNPTMLFEVQREIRRLAPSMDGQRLVVRAHPEVAAEMEAERAVVLEGLPWVNGTELIIRSDVAMHHEQFDIVSMSKRGETHKSEPPTRAGRRVEK